MKLSNLSGLRFPFGVRGAVASFIMIGLAGAGITAYTGAVFTDQATSSANTFTAGTLDLKLADGANPAADDITAQYNVSAMAPGDGQIVKTTVSNVGNIALRYALALTPSTYAITNFTAATPSVVTVTSHGLTTGASVTITGSTSARIDGTFYIKVLTADTFEIYDDSGLTTPHASAGTGTAGAMTSFGALYPALKWKIKTGGTCTPGAEAESVATFDGDGTIFVGSSGSSNYQALNLNAGLVFGDKTTGQDAAPNSGDRALAGSGSEVLCVKIVLPKATTGTPARGATPAAGYQAANTILNFEFDAEQTPNN